MATQPERLASLEQSRKMFSGFLVLLVPTLLGLAGWALHISTTLAAIKQQLADGGNKQIVGQLLSPDSPEKLKASLATVVAEVQTARADSTMPNAQKLATLSSAVGAVIQKHPDVPEAWQAASQLIAYRSNPTSAALPLDKSQPCYSLPFDAAPFPSTTFLDYQGIQVAQNCTVVLDDIEAYQESSFYKTMHKFQLEYPGREFMAPELHFTGVHVIYGGGPLPAVATIIFTNCTFELNVPGQPTRRGQILTRELLAANNIANVVVKS